MYGIYANIGGILMVNVAIYSIHGSYGSYGYKHGNHHGRINTARLRESPKTSGSNGVNWRGWMDGMWILGGSSSAWNWASNDQQRFKKCKDQRHSKDSKASIDGIWWYLMVFLFDFSWHFSPNDGKARGKATFPPPTSGAQDTSFSRPDDASQPQWMKPTNLSKLQTWASWCVGCAAYVYICMYVCKWLCGSYSLIWSLTQFNWYNLHFLKFCQIESVHVLDFLNHTKSMCLLMLIWCMPIAVIYGNSNTLW